MSEQVEPIYQEIGQNIKRWRQHLGYTQLRLGECTGMGRKYIGLIESGESRIQVHHLAKIAECLGISFIDLLMNIQPVWTLSGRKAHIQAHLDKLQSKQQVITEEIMAVRAMLAVLIDHPGEES